VFNHLLLYPKQWIKPKVELEVENPIVFPDQDLRLNVRPDSDVTVNVQIDGSDILVNQSLTGGEWTQLIIGSDTVNGLSDGYHKLSIVDANTGDEYVSHYIRKVNTVTGEYIEILDENGNPITGHIVYIDVKYGLRTKSYADWTLPKPENPTDLYVELYKKLSDTEMYYVIIPLSMESGSYATYRKNYDHVKVRVQLSDIESHIMRIVEVLDKSLTGFVSYILGLPEDKRKPMLTDLLAYLIVKNNPAYPPVDYYMDGDTLVLVYRVLPNMLTDLADKIIFLIAVAFILATSAVIRVLEIWTENHQLDVVNKLAEIDKRRLELIERAYNDYQNNVISREEFDKIVTGASIVYRTNESSVAGTYAVDTGILNTVQQFLQLVMVVLVMGIIKEIVGMVKRRKRE